MKITIEQIDNSQEEELVIRCHDPGEPWVLRAGSLLNTDNTVTGYRNNAAYRLKLTDVCYFEVVDGRGFLYGEKDVYESRLKLYEFEQISKKAGFFRAGKSLVVNADKIDHVEPSFSGRFHAVLLNGEKVIVSRQYVSELKRQMQL